MPPRAAKDWTDLVACLRKVTAVQDRRPAERIAIVLDGVYGRTFQERYPGDHWDRLQGTERLAGDARRYRSLENFIGTVSLEQDYVLKGLAEEEPAEDVLVLSTFHSANGKEGRVVFLIGLNQRRFPSARGLDKREKERRLFYVAVNRARDWLYLITTVKDVRGWQSIVTGPSIFLNCPE
ncbi:ATP-dependent helicase [Desulfosoma caldarium]|uniref:ATP-dependent helicase n=1 Tax=Desulfosoma caldarium TaxID=610254 RepID=UPI0014760FAC|nr:ATP-dependent helicase [Desulfosoma caldarium]